jgi:hypothetical protein
LTRCQSWINPSPPCFPSGVSSWLPPFLHFTVRSSSWPSADCFAPLAHR